MGHWSTHPRFGPGRAIDASHRHVHHSPDVRAIFASPCRTRWPSSHAVSRGLRSVGYVGHVRVFQDVAQSLS